MSSPSTIDTLLRSHDSGEYFARLVNRPAAHRLRVRPELAYHATLNDPELQEQMAELAAQWDRRLDTIKRLAETAHAENKRRPS